MSAREEAVSTELRILSDAAERWWAHNPEMAASLVTAARAALAMPVTVPCERCNGFGEIHGGEHVCPDCNGACVVTP